MQELIAKYKNISEAAKTAWEKYAKKYFFGHMGGYHAFLKYNFVQYHESGIYDEYPPGYEPQPVMNGLVSWWKLDEGEGSIAHDSKNGHDAEILNGTWIDDGAIGKALNMNGSSSEIIAGSDSELLPDAWTVEMWVRYTGTARHALFGWSSGGTSAYPGVILHYATAGHLIYMNSGNYAYFSTSPPVNDGNWHMIDIVMPGTGRYDIENAKMYVDGTELERTSLYTGTNQAEKEELRFCHVGWWYAGDIDELLIYNRVLSQSEIEQNFARR